MVGLWRGEPILAVHTKCDMSARAWRNRLTFADGGWGWAIGIPRCTKNLVTSSARVCDSTTQSLFTRVIIFLLSFLGTLIY